MYWIAQAPMALRTCFWMGVCAPGLSCALLGNTHLSHPFTWELESTDNDCLQLLHNLHLFWVPDLQFAELFELNGSSWSRVMLAEDKSWSTGIFRAALGPEDYCSPPLCAMERWCGCLEITLVVTERKNFHLSSRLFFLRTAAAFRYYLWEGWTGLMEGERSSSIASPPPSLHDGKQLLWALLPSGLQHSISAGAMAGAAWPGYCGGRHTRRAVSRQKARATGEVLGHFGVRWGSRKGKFSEWAQLTCRDRHAAGFCSPRRGAAGCSRRDLHTHGIKHL